MKADNVKELLRRIKYSVPITKFLAMDSNVREYLLYCALHVQATLGKPLVIPEYLAKKELSATEWEEYGHDLAGKKPYRYTQAPADKPSAAGYHLQPRGIQRQRTEQPPDEEMK